MIKQEELGIWGEALDEYADAQGNVPSHEGDEPENFFYEEDFDESEWRKFRGQAIRKLEQVKAKREQHRNQGGN